jgi:hypothetical protein
MKRFFTGVGCIAVVAVLGLAVAGCSNGSSSCDCPNGTLHLVGESCCSESDCVCERDVVGQRVQGIAVTNRDTVATFTTVSIPRVEQAVSLLTLQELAIIKSKVKEIRLQAGNGTASTAGGVITIRENTGASSIYNEFYDNYLVP